MSSINQDHVSDVSPNRSCFCSCQRVGVTRDVAVKTLLMLISYALVGPAVNIIGMTPVHMEELFDCSTGEFALSFTLQSCGVLLGAFLCATFLRRIAVELLLSIGLTVVLCTTAIAPFLPSIYFFLPIIMLQGCGLCIFNSEAQAYLLRLWLNHRLKGAMLQLGHAVWSLSIACSAFVINPFLIDLPSKFELNGNTSTSLTLTELYKNVQLVTESTTDFIALPVQYGSTTERLGEWNSSTTLDPLKDIERVRIPYLFLSIPLIIPSVSFFVIYLRGGASVWRVKDSKASDSPSKLRGVDKQQQRRDDKSLIAIFLLFTFFFTFADQRSFLAIFVVKYLGWSARRGTLINSTLYATMCFSRVIGTPLSVWIRPRFILIINLSFMAVSSFLFLLSEKHDVLMWMAAVCLGYGIATMFGTTILLVAEKLSFNSRLMAFFITSTSVAGILSPLIVGQLFRLTPLCVSYVMIGATFAAILVYVLLFVLLAHRKKSENNCEIDGDVGCVSDDETRQCGTVLAQAEPDEKLLKA